MSHSLSTPSRQTAKLKAHLRNPEMDLQPLTSNQLSQYFVRIKLKERRETLQPDLHLLCKMHLAHIQQIPYENLSLHLDKVSRRLRHAQEKLDKE